VGQRGQGITFKEKKESSYLQEYRGEKSLYLLKTPRRGESRQKGEKGGGVHETRRPLGGKVRSQRVKRASAKEENEEFSEKEKKRGK